MYIRLSFPLVPKHTMPRWLNLQEHLISHCKLQRSPSNTCIALLSTLSNQQVLSNFMYFIMICRTQSGPTMERSPTTSSQSGEIQAHTMLCMKPSKNQPDNYCCKQTPPKAGDLPNIPSMKAYRLATYPSRSK